MTFIGINEPHTLGLFTHLFVPLSPSKLSSTTVKTIRKPQTKLISKAAFQKVYLLLIQAGLYAFKLRKNNQKKAALSYIAFKKQISF